MKIKNILILALLFAMQSLFCQDKFNLSYNNTHVMIIKDIEAYKNRVIFEKIQGLSDDRINELEFVRARGGTDEYFIDIIENIDEPIQLLYNKIQSKYKIVGIRLYIRKAKENNIQYIYSMCFKIDYNQDYDMFVDIDIDYGYSLPLQYSDTANITKLIDEIMTYRVRNINQLGSSKPIPIPDADQSELPDSLDWPTINMFKNKEN